MSHPVRSLSRCPLPVPPRSAAPSSSAPEPPRRRPGRPPSGSWSTTRPLADPAAVVGALHDGVEHPHARRDRAGRRSGARSARPSRIVEPPWQLGAGFEPWADRLHFLVWANSYDARADGEPIWWWGRKAVRLGATEGGPSRRRCCRRHPAWIDGGPRAPLAVPLDGAAVVHSDTVELGSARDRSRRRWRRARCWRPTSWRPSPTVPGPARIIAPAGSGKTRCSPSATATSSPTAATSARRSSPSPTTRRRRRRWRRACPASARASRRSTRGATASSPGRWAAGPSCSTSVRCASIVEKLVPSKQRRVNTDPIAPYLDGLSLIRLGLRDPQEVEDALDDVTGLAAAYEPYRDALRQRGAIDFDEQVFGAARGAPARRRAAPSGAGRPPPPPRRRAAGPHAGPRAARPPGRRARPPTCSASATTTSPSTDTSARPAVPRRLRARTSPARRSTPSR